MAIVRLQFGSLQAEIRFLSQSAQIDIVFDKRKNVTVSFLLGLSKAFDVHDIVAYCIMSSRHINITPYPALTFT